MLSFLTSLPTSESNLIFPMHEFSESSTQDLTLISGFPRTLYIFFRLYISLLCFPYRLSSLVVKQLNIPHQLSQSLTPRSSSNIRFSPHYIFFRLYISHSLSFSSPFRKQVNISHEQSESITRLRHVLSALSLSLILPLYTFLTPVIKQLNISHQPSENLTQDLTALSRFLRSLYIIFISRQDHRRAGTNFLTPGDS